MANKNNNSSRKTNDYIYSLLKSAFNFEEIKYEDYIKDVIEILIENEKNGEPIIDIDSNSIGHNLIKEGWPEKHLIALEKSGLINKNNSPIVFKNRNISWQKWSKKIEKITERLLNKKNSTNNKSSFRNSIKEINSKIIFDKLNDTNIVLLQGGPGTGKTTLIINLILDYLESDQTLNIGIAAPTGKAAARLKESINKLRKDKNVIILDRIECQTLHRWIYNSYSRSINLKYKLNELDIFIIDEMSMVNIDLLENILDNLTNDCKILLVGDANQLPPVNNCSIWNHIFKNEKESSFESCIMNLSKTYRNKGDIESLSKKIFPISKDKFSMESINIGTKEKSNLKVIKETNFVIPKELVNKINSFIIKLQISTSKLSKKDYIFESKVENLIDLEKDLVEKIFYDLNSHMVLCVKNKGTWSVNEINKNFIKQEEPYNFLTLEEGIPIMCIENNNELGISNGDIGLLIGKNKTRRFLFRKFNKRNEPIIALIDPSKLSSIIPAIAITIHKAQGSESDYVSILWPNQISALDQKEEGKVLINNIIFKDKYEKSLFYTAITRAKKKLDLYLLK